MNNDMCEECGGTGIYAPGPDILGMPNGWVQRCDTCEQFDNDLTAMNVHRQRKRLEPMQGYPFSIVCRDDATPKRAIEQTFFLKVTFDATDRATLKTNKGLAEECAITLRNEGNSLHDENGLFNAIMENAEDWLITSGHQLVAVHDVVVTNCEPAVENAP